VIREVEDDTPVVDHFPAIDFDGYSKRSGLLQSASDFVVTSFRNGQLVVLTVDITEIEATGEYLLEWTPADQAFGYYQIQVLINFNKDIWYGTYNVVDQLSTDVLEAIRVQGNKLDSAPTLGPNQVTTGSLVDRMLNKDSSKTYNQGTDSQQAIADRLGGI